LGASAILEALEPYATGALLPVPQPTEGVTYAAKLEKSEALIDWARDAAEIERQVRAFNPWPVAETRLDGEQLRVFEAVASPASATAASGSLTSAASAPRMAAPGTIIALRDDALLVQCGQGCLAVLQLQRPGRRAVSAGDFIRGAGADLLGKRLG
jgi:methionyl-tRNA formyltransferase